MIARMAVMGTHAPDCEGFDDPLAVEHGICKSWCHAHANCEPLRRSDYQYCIECGHVFRTASELLRSHNEVLREMDLPRETDPKQVFCCPHCVHDF